MATVTLNKHTVPVLTADNYTIWKTKLKMYLTLKGLWSAVETSAALLTTDDLQSASARALAIIGLSVSDHHLAIIAACESAHEAWKTLSNIFEPLIAGRAIRLQRELSNLQMLDTESIEVYIGRSRQLFADLSMAQVPVTEHQVVSSAISGLPARFDTVVTIYQQQATVLTFHDVQAALIQFEHTHALRVRATATPAVAFPAQFHKPKPKHKPSPANSPQSQSQSDRRPRPRCSPCDRNGHVVDQCWSLHPTPMPERFRKHKHKVIPSLSTAHPPMRTGGQLPFQPSLPLFPLTLGSWTLALKPVSVLTPLFFVTSDPPQVARLYCLVMLVYSLSHTPALLSSCVLLVMMMCVNSPSEV